MKIKRVDIKAFRLFSDVSVDLTASKNPDKAANFVAIYAPNGFGKTSFIDALEFCMTKSIHRLKSNFKENFSVDQKHGISTFIHNKDLPDQPIEINMSFEGATDVRTTCKPEDECTLLRSNEVENAFFRDAILSQDWLSEFLSSKSSVDRFKIFTENFEETQDLISYYSSLISKSKQLIKLINRKKKELLALQKTIDKKINASAFQMFDILLPKLENFGYDLTFDPKNDEALFDSKLEGEALRGILNDQNDYLSELIYNLNKVQLGEDELLKISELQERCHELESVRKKRETCQNQLTMIKLLKNLNQQELDFCKDLDEKKKRLDTLVFLLTNFEYYQGWLNKIADVEKNMKDSNLNLEKKQLERRKEVESIAQCSDDRARLDAQRQLYGNKLATLSESYARYIDLQNRLSQDRKTLLEQNGLLQNDLNIVEQLKIEHNALLQLESTLCNKQIEFIPGIFEEDVRSLLELRCQLNNLQENLNECEQRVEEGTRLNDNLQSLLVSSQGLVERLKSSKCPLCGFDYEQHEILLSSISTNTVLVDSLKNDVVIRDALRQQVAAKMKEISVAATSLQRKVENRIKVVDDRLISIGKQCDTRRLQINLLKDTIDQTITVLSDTYLDFKDLTEEDIRCKYNSTYEHLEFKISQTDNLIKAKEHNLHLLDKEIERLQTLFLEHSKLLVELKEEEVFLKYQKCSGLVEVSALKKIEWTDEQIQINAIVNKLSHEINLLRSQQEELKNQGVNIILESILLQQEEILNADFTTLDSRINRTVNFLKTNCSLETITVPFDCEQIMTLHQETLREKLYLRKQLSEKILLVQQYINSIELAIKYSENEKRKKQCDNFIEEIQKYEHIVNAVDAEKNRLQVFLEEFVNGFFQLDVINKLYNIIDPHPDYKKICFECNFDNKDPRLNVLMYSSDGKNDKIVPNLYFSTAQINILSFCIFMAKALFSKTSKGKDLECIFIDDPIQALDDINILSMIDLLRNVAFSLNKQIVLTTHDKDFFELLKMKVPDRLFNSRFIEFKDRGVIA